ncbi:MAG TPA: chemotaxis protein CheA [Acidimicrobiales bacterium]|nr:chemotaxis protein CheA [Acidimicrobiales bacterium]
MNDDAMNEIVQEFLVETNENLDQLDQDLVALESDPSSRELLGSVFRTIHTVKGTTGFLGFGRLEGLSHAAENLLSDLRDGRLMLTSARTDVLLEVVDAIRALLAAIEATGAEDDRDLSDLIARIKVLQQPEAVAVAEAPPAAIEVDAPARQSAEALAAVEAPVSAEAAAVADVVAVAEAPVAPEAVAVAEAVVAPEAIVADVPAPALASAGAGAPHASERGPGTTPSTRPATGAAEPPHGEPHRSAGERSVRVDVDLLDSMMSQVGELVLARNQVSAHVELLDNQALHQTVQRLSMIVSELQEGVMKTRMQPVEQLWSKLPRVIRDLAAQFSKQVTLEMEGGETELDRSLLEAVKDPLTHLVRNAIDHAIERPEARVAAGKPATGTLALRASHEGGQVVLEVADDGAGIDPDKIAAKALERGLVSKSQLDAMSEREIVDLIFRPGFSTAQAVTNVSGRGVGMDVVRTNVERIGGTVDLTSAPGMGTTVRIKIPLTLAIIPALLVGCRDQRYAIPQANLLEMVQLRAEGTSTDIERIGGALVYRLRGKLLPLVRLDETLGYSPLAADDQPDAVSIVVLQADGLLLGVAVDEVFGTEEIVVKPLGRHVKQVPLFAGATILGDGGVALILDVLGLATAARVEEVTAGLALSSDATEDERATERSTFVLLRVGRERRVAVPLKAVARLEEAPAASVEHAGNGQVLQYRGDLLPLVALAAILDDAAGDSPAEHSPDEAPATIPVVVYSDGDRHLGLVASEILDIVEGIFEVRPVGAAPGILGSTVVHGHVTDVLDVDAAFALAGKEPERVA